MNLLYDAYKGYHEVALKACLGMGDEKIMNLLPRKDWGLESVDCRSSLWGWRDERTSKEVGYCVVSPTEVADNSSGTGMVEKYWSV